VLNGEPSIEKIGGYHSMSACFEQRDNMLIDYKAWDGLFPLGVQAVCIKYK
jgi:hypothetical protein